MNKINVIDGCCAAVGRVAASGRKKRGVRKAAADVGFLAAIDAEIAELRHRQCFGRVNGYTSARRSFGRFLAESGCGADDYDGCCNHKNSGKSAFSCSVSADACASTEDNSRADVRLSDVTAALIREYERWLRGNGVTRNTMSFYMRELRAVFNRAARKYGLVVENPFADVYTGNDRTAKRNITRATVQQIINLDLSRRKGLSFARDMFLFSLLARGMPFVDIAYLRWSDIRGRTLTYCRHKTGQPIKLSLEPQALAIIERWHVPGSDLVFPILDAALDGAQMYRQYRSALSLHNKRLRQISELVGGDVHLTSYVARHTWATLAWECDIPLSEISVALGHTSERTTRIYLDMMENSRLDRHCRRVVRKFRFNSTQ